MFRKESQGRLVSPSGAPAGRLIVGIGLLCVLISGTGTAAWGAAEPKSATKAVPWDESAGLQATCADTLDSFARIFDSPDYQQQLLVPGRGNNAFLLGLKAQTVAVLPKKSVTWNDDDKPVFDASLAVPDGAFVRDGGVVSFVADGGDWKIQPEPPLVGMLPLAKLLEAKPDYVHAAARFAPDEKSVKFLQGMSTDTRITVFFGTWCTFCKHWLPRFIKTLDVAKNPKITAEFIGMSEDQAEPKDLIKQYSVTQTPTFVVTQGGKELGRIEEKPEVSVEADLARILGAR